MISSLATANLLYVGYRLLVSAPIVRLLSTKMDYYWAVFLMAQFSFIFDLFVFNTVVALEPTIKGVVYTDVVYVVRVILAWWLIKQIQKLTNNFWLSVFIGAQMTFVVDWWIFSTLL